MSSTKIFFLPTAQNFSDMEYAEESYEIPPYETDWSEVFIEDTILSMLGELKTDREKVIFLLMAMGKDGYDFQHKDVATLFQIDYSWYMRIVRGIKSQLLSFLDVNLVKVDQKVQKNGKKQQNTQKPE